VEELSPSTEPKLINFLPRRPIQMIIRLPDLEEN